MNQILGDITEGSIGHTQSMKTDGLLVSVAADLLTFREKDVWLVNPTYMDPVEKSTWAGARTSVDKSLTIIL